ncbi:MULTISPECIES: hypothetical protein [Providencia]|uniref:hypothetical protein n=1 Tax=Providencia TaxID=586 RepID=UPI001373BC6A|nr:hypothetical protein [Providencia sp. PROV156]BBU96492.1 hypothetical protein BML2496_23750 [Providencia rettgeri]
MKKNVFRTVLEPVKVRQISPSEMVKMTPEQADNVERVEYKAPKLGGEGFGSFLVTYKTPVLCESNL